MTTIATLTVKLIGDIAQYSAAMADAESTSKNVSAKISQNLKDAGQQLTQTGQMMTLGLTVPILGVATAAVKAASDLNETKNKVKILFGDMTDSVMGWSKNSVDALEMSQQQALDNVSGMKLFADQAGLAGDQALKFSESNVQLAADMASFFNTSPQDALDAISSAYEGMTRPIRAYHVLLDQQSIKEEAIKLGLIGVHDQLTKQQQILAVNALIMQQTAPAQGDVARTSEELAGSMRKLTAEYNDASTKLGTILLPYVLQGVHFLNQLLTQFQMLSPEQQKWIVIIGLGVAAIGPLLVIVGSLITAIGAIIPVVTAVAGVMTFPLIAIIAAVAAAIAVLYVAWQNNWGGIRNETQSAVTFIKAVVAAFQLAFNGDWYAFGQRLREAWDVAWTAIANIDWYAIGKNAILGILNGIMSMRQALIDGLVNVAKNAYEAARGFLGIHSESSLLREELGKNMALGTISGWEKYLKPMSLQPALASAVNMPSASIPAMSSNVFGGNGGSADLAQVIDLLQQLLAKSSLDETKLARAIRDSVLKVVG